MARDQRRNIMATSRHLARDIAATSHRRPAISRQYHSVAHGDLTASLCDRRMISPHDHDYYGAGVIRRTWWTFRAPNTAAVPDILRRRNPSGLLMEVRAYGALDSWIGVRLDIYINPRIDAFPGRLQCLPLTAMSQTCSETATQTSSEETSHASTRRALWHRQVCHCTHAFTPILRPAD